MHKQIILLATEVEFSAKFALPFSVGKKSTNDFGKNVA